MNANPQRTRTPSADLFPETMIVACINGTPMTDTLEVAKYFKKRHTEVLRAHANLECSEAFRQRNFASANYLDAQKKPRQMVRMTRNGFAFMAMGFTGKEAAFWKESFLDRFDAMEAQLHAQAEREAHALYQVRPRWQPIARNPGLSRQELIALTGHRSPASVTACRQRMREVGLLPGVPSGQKQSGHQIALTEGGAA